MRSPKRLFVSHASADREFVEKFASVLREHGVRFWYSRKHILGAQQWHDEIGIALRTCDWFALILTPESTSSKWVRRELSYALRQDRYENHIVPVLLRDCDIDGLSWVLGSLQFVDFSKNFETGCRELLKIWGKQYRALPTKSRIRSRER